MEKSKSSLLSSSMLCVRQMVLRVGFKFKLATARVRRPRPSRLLMALLAGCGVQVAQALPQGGQVASGNVSIAAPAGNTLTVTQTTSKGIVNWQSFNVASGEKVNFQQPGATSSTLNRVIGSDPSSIFGQINANGQVFLINNSGILFAPGAQVNAAGLVASTLQLADADYLAGNYVFSGAGGSVTNQGVIKAGFVALAGAQVSNTGTIVADGGTAALAAGDRVTLDLIGNDLVSMSVDAPTAAALVHAGGIVQADGGRVLISAKAADALLGTVVNVDGIVQAHAIGSRNGVITLDGGASGVVAVSGTLDASGKGAGQAGGTVKVTGADVGLFDQASIDVSGDAGGGVVRIGGDWHGAGADGDANASQAYIGSNATIAANAIGSGKGGNVVVWSDDHTQVFGSIAAHGGATGGDGGAIETSSVHALQVAGAVDASAAHGRAGQWLIDPSEITISSGSNSVGGNGSSGNPFTDTTAPSILNTTTLHNALNTADVIVTTSGASGGDGVITVAGAITSKNNGDSSLTLNASTKIDFVSGTIAPGGTGKLAVTLNAGSGGVAMDSGSSINTGGGVLSVSSGGTVAMQGLTVSGALTSVTTTAGNIALSGSNTLSSFEAHDADAAGNVSVAVSGALALAGVDNNAGGALAGDLTVTAGGAIIQAGAIKVAGTTAVTTAAGNITLTGSNSIATFAAHDADVAGNVSITTGGALALGNVDNGSGGALGGGLTVNAGGTVSQVASTALKVAGTTTATTSIGDIALIGSNTIAKFAAHDADAAGNVSITTGGTLALGNVDNGSGGALGGGLTVNAGGTISQVGSTALKVAGTTTATTSVGDITLTGSNSIATLAAHDADAAGNVSVTTGGALALGNVDNGSGGALGGGLTVNAGGTVSQVASTALKVAGTTTATTSVGGIVLTGSNSIATFAAHDADAAGNVSVTTGGALALGNVDNGSSSALGGGLTVNAGGTISQVASTALKVAGTTTATTSLGDIALTGSNSIATFAAHDADAAGNVSVTTGGTLALGNVDNGSGGALGGGLTVSAGGTVSQVASTALKVAGTTTATTSVGDIVLTGSNTIATLAAHDADAAGNVSVTTGGALALANVDNGSSAALGGDLTVNAGGTVSQVASTALKVAGTTAATTSAGDIALTGSNSIATFAAHDADAAGNVSITTGGALALGNVDNGSGGALGGGLTVNAGGTVSQVASTALKVGGATSATASGGNVTLGNTGNVFVGAVSATGNSVDIAATGALQASATLASGSGDLTLSATGVLSGVTAVTTTGNIALSSGGALTTAGALSGHDVSLTGSTLTLQNDVTAGNNLSLSATNGGINQIAGTAAALGTTTLTAAGAGNTITLGDVGNNFVGAVNVSGGAVNLSDISALTVDGTIVSGLTVSGNGVAFGPGTTTVGGLLSVTAGAGAITQSGRLAVAGSTTLTTTGSGTVTLADPTNVFTGLVTATGSSITIGAAGDLAVTPNLPGGTGNLTLAAYGPAAALSIPGGTISTTGDVSLSAGAGLSTSGDITAHNVALGGGALVIANHISASGTFDATSTSTITETGSGDIHAAGATTLDAGANAITLGAATNSFGTVSATGGAVTLADAAGMTVHLNNVASANLAAGTGVLTVDGATTAGDLVATAGNGIVFGTATVGGSTAVNGNLSASSGTGAISQVNNLTVTGASTLNAGSSDILLHSALNDFGGTVTATGGLVAISDINALTVHLVSASTAGLQAGGLLTVDGSATGMLQAGGNGISFGTTSAGTLLATGNNGAITQTGALSTASSSSITTTGQDVTLTNAGNHLLGNLTVGGANVAVTNAGALIVDGSTSGGLTLAGAGVSLAVTVGGALNVASSGAIAAGGAVQVAGASTLDAGASDITITQPGSHFGGLVTATGGAIDIVDSGALNAHLASATSASLTATGALAVAGATTGNLTASGASVALGATTVGGALSATASAGDVTQTGAVAVTGATTLAASAGAIALANAGNDFGGLVTASASANVGLADVNALSAHLAGAGSATLAAGGVLTVDGSSSGALQANGNGVVFGAGGTVAGGALAANSGGGTITQAGSLSVVGASTLNAGSNAITLVTAANDFGGAVTANGGSVSLADANALTAHVASGGDATLAAAGLLTVDGSSGGGLSATGAGIVLGATHVAGALVAASGTGPITQTGALVVAGASTLDAGAGAITLTNAGNDFTGAVSATGGAVSLADANALAAHLAATSAALNAGGVLTVDGSSSGALAASGNGVVLGATTVGGNLSAASGTGTLTQTGALAVTGTSTLVAGSHAITLANAANDFGGAVTATGGAVTLTDANALSAHLTAASATLAAAGALTVDGSTSAALAATGSGIAFGPASTTVNGALTATSTGAVTQSGDVAVTGATTISAAGQNVTLTRQTNHFAGAVTVAAAAADIEQAGALAVNLNNVGSAVVKSGAGLAVHGSSTGNVTASGASVSLGGSVLAVGGNLAATSSAGDITQAGTLSVAGTSTLAAGSGNVTLADSANALVGAVTASGANITLADASPLTAHLAANGSGTLSSAGALSVDGSAGALALTGTSVGFGAAGTTVNGALTTNGGGVTQAGSLSVAGPSTFNAGTNDILLDAPGANLQGAITATGHTIRLNDAHAIDATIAATGDTVLSSTSDVLAKGSFGGGLKIAGAKVSLNTGAGAPPLTVGGLLAITSSGDTALGDVTANGAQVTAGGTLLMGGTLASTADVSLKAAAIQGVAKLGALSVASGAKVTLDTSGAGGGNIGKTTALVGTVDDAAIIKLLGATGQSGLNINFITGQSAWFRVSSQTQTHLLQPHQYDFLAAQTFFCDLATCVNVLGQTTAIADSVIANILTAASQDAADAAFGTENLDFAIRKGYVTTIGRVPPGIDEIAGDLGATACDSRVTSPTAIAADKACK